MIEAIRRFVYLRYLFASAGALGVDMGLFLAAMASGVRPMVASGLGYSAGIAAHWLLSSRTVFAGRIARPGRPRRQQQALFLTSALAGLAITMAIVGLGEALAADPRLAKLVAVGLAFQCTYILRQRIVFA